MKLKTTSLVIREITAEAAKSIITTPEIYDRITDDNCPPLSEYRFQDPFGSTYLGCYSQGNLVGLLILHGNEIHFQVLREFRNGRLKSDFLQAALNMINKPVFAEIPNLYPEVISFARREGFREERIIPNDFQKHGKLYDRHVMVYP